MRYAFILTPALVLAAAACAPSAGAKTCSKICHNPVAHVKAAPTPFTSRIAYKKADHSHVTVYNGEQHGLSAGRIQNGVRVLSPAPLFNDRQQAGFAAAARRADAQAAQRELSQTRARLTASVQAETAARLAAIEAKQDLSLERQARATKPRRRSFIGNNRFFGRNGFIGNSNFSGATVSTKRGGTSSKIARKPQRGF